MQKYKHWNYRQIGWQVLRFRKQLFFGSSALPHRLLIWTSPAASGAVLMEALGQVLRDSTLLSKRNWLRPGRREVQLVNSPTRARPLSPSRTCAAATSTGLPESLAI